MAAVACGGDNDPTPRTQLGRQRLVFSFAFMMPVIPRSFVVYVALQCTVCLGPATSTGTG